MFHPVRVVTSATSRWRVEPHLAAAPGRRTWPPRLAAAPGRRAQCLLSDTVRTQFLFFLRPVSQYTVLSSDSFFVVVKSYDVFFNNFIEK